jgi:hypothetical protein
MHQEPATGRGERHHQMAKDLPYGPGVAQAAGLELVIVEAVEEVGQ